MNEHLEISAEFAARRIMDLNPMSLAEESYTLHMIKAAMSVLRNEDDGATRRIAANEATKLLDKLSENLSHRKKKEAQARILK